MERPHSSRSQFNKRTPKSGPSPLSRATTVDKDPPKMPPKKKAQSAESGPPSSTFGKVRRPIATNSRIRQEETTKREMYLSFVTKALEERRFGLNENFDELVSEFNLSQRTQAQSQVDTAQIRLWLNALSHVVSRFERTHSSLVESIVNMPWTILDNATVKSYTVFIGMLLSAKPEYLSMVLAKIAHAFTYQSSPQTLEVPSTSQTPPLTRRTISDRLHYLLQHLITLIPTLPRTLQPLLVKHFPHKRQNQLAQVTYIKNLLKVTTYCPELAEKILGIIIDRAIQIDVEVQIEVEELEERMEEASNPLFDMDPFDIVLGQEPSSSSDSDDDSGAESDDEDNEGDTFSDISSDAGDGDIDFNDSKAKHQDVPTDLKHVHEMTHKLDAILLLLFEHFDQTRIRCGALQNHDRTNNDQSSSPSELPLLPTLEFPSSSALNSPIASMISTPFARSSSVDLLGIHPAFIPPTPPLPSIASTPTLSSQSVSSTLETLSSNTNPRTVPKTSKSSRQTLRNQFYALLAIFDRTILRTFKSRYTQFLLFWYASLNHEFSDVVLGMLVERALMDSSPAPMAVALSDETLEGEQKPPQIITPEVTRSAAASYIGSFVSRATFVDGEVTRNVVGVLCEYLQAHLDGVEATLRNDGTQDIAGGSQHMAFYAVIQAVLLIFCFRWRDLVGSADDEGDEGDDPFSHSFDPTAASSSTDQHIPTRPASWIHPLSTLKRCIFSILNPLRVCTPNVVMQFSRVANATGFMYCYSLLGEDAKKGTSPPCPSVDDTSTKAPSNNKIHPSLYSYAELHNFFPFDPYRLPKSGAFIDGVYREWKSVAIDEDDSDEEEDELVNEDGEDKGYLTISRRKEEDDGGLGTSFGVMSISPQPSAPLRELEPAMCL